MGILTSGKSTLLGIAILACLAALSCLGDNAIEEAERRTGGGIVGDTQFTRRIVRDVICIVGPNANGYDNSPYTRTQSDPRHRIPEGAVVRVIAHYGDFAALVVPVRPYEGVPPKFWISGDNLTRRDPVE